MWLLIIATLIKIVIVIAILLGIAPVLTWAERRQSAMMQDRVGPVRGGLPLPRGLADFIQGPASAGAKVVAYVTAALAGISAVVTALLYTFRWQIHTMLATDDGRAELAAQWSEGSVWWSFMLGADGEAAVASALRNDAGSLQSAVDAAFSPVLQFYGWLIVAFIFLSLAHVAASWFVRHMIDKRGHLTAFGLIHPLADVMKMVWKEDFIPPKADKFLHSAAPILATIPAFATFAVIPFGPDLYWGPESGPFYQYLFEIIPAGAALDARVIPLQVVNINVGILYIFAIAGTGIVGAAIAGYSSDNKYALLGGLRAASQMVSYEVTLGLTLVGCFMVYGTLLLDEMVAWQQAHVWGVVVQPLALVLYFFSSLAEMKRVPFDAPEGESEIVAGYFLEYSGMKWGLFMTGEFVEHIVTSAIIVTLFFGGYDVPFLHSDGFHLDFLGVFVPIPHLGVILISMIVFLLKIGVFCFLQLQVRWTLPRFRYDQIMQLCWKIILPLSLANILVTGIVILLLQ